MSRATLVLILIGLTAAACGGTSGGSTGDGGHGGDGGGGSKDGGVVCVVEGGADGETVKPGQSYTAPGTCGNTCICEPDGTSACDKLCMNTGDASMPHDAGSDGGG